MKMIARMQRKIKEVNEAEAESRVRGWKGSGDEGRGADAGGTEEDRRDGG